LGEAYSLCVKVGVIDKRHEEVDLTIFEMKCDEEEGVEGGKMHLSEGEILATEVCHN